MPRGKDKERKGKQRGGDEGTMGDEVTPESNRGESAGTMEKTERVGKRGG